MRKEFVNILGLEQAKQKTEIKINSSIKFPNENWIKQSIRDFIKDNHPKLEKYSMELDLRHQTTKNKTIKVTACLKERNGMTFAKGEGRDEYEAVDDMLNNLDLELRIKGSEKKASKRLFSSDTLNKIIGGNQYA